MPEHSQPDSQQIQSLIKHYLTIVILKDEVMAYQKSDMSAWQSIYIKGEAKLSHHSNNNILEIVLDDISANFNLKHGLADIKVSILYQQGTNDLLTDAIKNLQKHHCKFWQILGIESVYHYALALKGKSDSVSFDSHHLETKWLVDELLPLVWHEDSLIYRQQGLQELYQQKQQLERQITLMQDDAEKVLAKQVQQLEQDKASLQQQISEAKNRLQRLQSPDMESLISYLPAIFKEFWNVVRPDELAMLVGQINPPQISSPYNSPTLSAVQQKKRQFSAMSEENQEKIIQLCRELVQNYQQLAIHAEFKPLIGELD